MKIILLCCEQCLRAGEDVSAALKEADGLDIRVERLPCSSKVRVSHLLKILDRDIDGLELVGCPEETCRFLVGSRRAEKRIAYARQLLREAGLPAERLGLSRGKDFSASDLVSLARRRAAALDQAGLKEEKGPST